MSIVVSASRMTDMPKFYPYSLIEEVEKRLTKGMAIHTLVLWTKHPGSLFVNPLHDFLVYLRSAGIQLYLQLTITGLGGLPTGERPNGSPLILEPYAPLYQESLATIPDIIGLLGKPERIRLRIDPLVRISDISGHVFSNLPMLPHIVREGVAHGIKNYTISFLERGIHKKVDARFKQIGCRILSPTRDERQQAAIWFKKIEHRFGITISACCVPGFPESQCIDGRLLRDLHELGQETDLKQPRKRALCGCTKSIDIGGWPPKKCFTGCDYCYANAAYVD